MGNPIYEKRKRVLKDQGYMFGKIKFGLQEIYPGKDAAPFNYPEGNGHLKRFAWISLETGKILDASGGEWKRKGCFDLVQDIVGESEMHHTLEEIHKQYIYEKIQLHLRRKALNRR